MHGFLRRLAPGFCCLSDRDHGGSYGLKILMGERASGGLRSQYVSADVTLYTGPGVG